ncbi:MAG: hypothetical protein J6Q05_03605, partial [Elusimicrobiaceae bacterium]|nr:hypothetical protein [Elusimicrobiaceae bacterium]
MKQLLTLLLAAFLGVLAVDACAQRGMPSKLFRQFLEHPGQFPRARLTELTDRQLTQLISCLKREKTRLTQHTQQERLRQARIFETSRLAVFRVLSQQQNGLHSLSGTLFKTQYAGEPEVFGVIPMHVLQNKDHISGSISKQFTVSVQTAQGVQMIPAEVVQLSSSKTGDLALIKFRAQDEALLSPLSLANMPDQ